MHTSRELRRWTARRLLEEYRKGSREDYFSLTEKQLAYYELLEDVLKFLTILGMIMLVLIGVLGLFGKSEKCVKSGVGPSYNHAPVYIHSGNVLVPVGGGYYGDYKCEKWSK